MAILRRANKAKVGPPATLEKAGSSCGHIVEADFITRHWLAVLATFYTLLG